MIFTAGPGAVEAQQINAPTAVTIFRTIVAHELTHYQHQRYDEYYHPQISSDGSRIAYATFDRPNGHEYLYLVNFDGSNPQVLIDRVNGALTYYDFHLSGNGQRVLLNLGGEIWVFQPGIAATFSYIPFGQATDLRSLTLTSDGDQVYFALTSDRTLNGNAVPRGIYRMNYDGTGVQRIITPEMLALATGEDISTFTTLYVNSISASHDGGRLALSLSETWQNINIFLLAYDGQLRLLRPKGAYANMLISADGSTLVANGNYTDLNTYAMTWAGGDVRTVPGEVNCNHALQVTGIGSHFLMNCLASPMINIATGNRELYLGRGSFEVPVNALMAASMINASMSYDGKRFAFNTNDPNNYNQIATAEVNPTNLGAAPQISNPNLNLPFLQSDYGSVATLSFDTDLKTYTGMNIGTGGTYQGTESFSISFPSWFTAVPGGHYESVIDASSGAADGFYTYRIVADIMAPDGRRHASAVYFGPVIVDAAPPTSAAIDFTTGKPGSYFTVTGNGFAPGSLVTAAVNGWVISDSLLVDDTGVLTFYLNTAPADLGKYMDDHKIRGCPEIAFRAARLSHLAIPKGKNRNFMDLTSNLKLVTYHRQENL